MRADIVYIRRDSTHHHHQNQSAAHVPEAALPRNVHAAQRDWAVIRCDLESFAVAEGQRPAEVRSHCSTSSLGRVKA